LSWAENEDIPEITEWMELYSFDSGAMLDYV